MTCAESFREEGGLCVTVLGSGWEGPVSVAQAQPVLQRVVRLGFG